MSHGEGSLKLCVFREVGALIDASAPLRYGVISTSNR